MIILIVYRPHRRLLCEAMQEVKYFSSIEGMFQFVKSDWRKYYPDYLEVVLGEDEVDDDRNGWHHTRYVCIKTSPDEYPQCVGMCDLASFSKNKS